MMKMLSKKDKALIKDAKENGTPIFVLSAKDVLSSDTIAGYLSLCSMSGAPKEHYDAATARYEEFIEWQDANVKRVKIPD